MIRLVLLLPLALAACATGPAALPGPPGMATPSAPTSDNLQGRWSIAAVDGERVEGLWLELGGEGPATVTEQGNAVFVRAPQPPTRAHLGCNDLRANGWTRNGDTLSLGIEMSSMTERGCGHVIETIERRAHNILRKPMGMEFARPGELRLINENGTLDLVRDDD